MKKRIFSYIILLFSLVNLVSCNGDDKIYDEKILYSNISDEKSKLEIKNILEKSDIPKLNVERFFKQVDDYNETIEFIDLTKDGFEEKRDLDIDYDVVKITELWEEEKGMFIGNNCRITSFDLMEGLINIPEDDKIEGKNLFMDLDAIEFDDSRDINDEKYIKFKTLYGNMSTNNTDKVNTHVKRYKQEMENREVKFNDDLNVSHIGVVFHDTLDTVLFIGHTGILIDYEEGLLFIEKLNFSEPYQAIKFENRLDLYNYLMNKYDVSYGQEEAKPFVMENDELINIKN